MRVRDWMSPDPVAVAPTDTVREARMLLHRYGIRHLPVVERDRVVGVVSDRDVRIDDVLLGQIAKTRDVDGVLGGVRTVASVMSSPAHTIRDDASMEAAARAMLSRRISALPVVDVDGALVGVVTTTDCLLASLQATAHSR
jgi:acetoin utilization protein AcuB